MTVDVLNKARLVFSQRSRESAVAFAAGSPVRGEGTAYSRLDLAAKCYRYHRR